MRIQNGGCHLSGQLPPPEELEELEASADYVHNAYGYAAAYSDGEPVDLAPYRKLLKKVATDGLDAFPYASHLSYAMLSDFPFPYDMYQRTYDIEPDSLALRKQAEAEQWTSLERAVVIQPLYVEALAASQEWKEDEQLKNDLLLCFAKAEAMYHLEQGETDTFCIINYSTRSDDVYSGFYVYTYRR